MTAIETIEICNYCTQPSKRLILCTQCKAVKYCSNKCKIQAWNKHRESCIDSDLNVIETIKTDIQGILSIKPFANFIHILAYKWNVVGQTYMECIIKKVNDFPRILDIHITRKKNPKGSTNESSAQFIYIRRPPAKNHIVRVLLDYEFASERYSERDQILFLNIDKDTKIIARIGPTPHVYIGSRMFALA